MNERQLEALLERLEQCDLPEADRKLLEQAVYAAVFLGKELQSKSVTINKLRRAFGIKSEKAAAIGVEKREPDRPVVDPEVRQDDDDNPDDDPPNDGGGPGASRRGDGKKRGHGRRAAEDIPAAEVETHKHPDLNKGDACPECDKGKLYELPAGSLIRLHGQAPLKAVIHKPERLRCATCGEVFTAPLPESVGDELADPSAKAVVAVLHYGAGMPFHRLARLQAGLGVPVPASTQWDLVESVARVAMKVWHALKRLAAHASKIHVDDTSGRVAELRKKPVAGLESDRSAEPDDEAVLDDAVELDPKRRGIYTSSIVARLADGRDIYLYFTGRRYAGENLAAILKERPEALGPPIESCDALPHNIPKGFKTVLSKCLTHGRRGFVDALSAFPAECGHVIAELAEVYHYDGIAAEWGFSPRERLLFHQDKSGPVMARLHAWMLEQLATGAVEENGGLGKAMSYMLRHWEGLTAFLRVEGAPLANDIAERALKWAIIYRKNSYQYKTVNGALVGDILMSVIRTCLAAAKNPIDYLVALLKNAAAVREAPEHWLPWNYCPQS